MSMLINVISAIGNNNSFAPLLVRDCGIEAPTKVAQTYNQNAKESAIMAKHATRERIIDEYGASAIWLGGVPAVEYLCNKIIDKKGINSKINYKLLDNNKNAMSDIDRKQQSVDINIKKFENNKSQDVADAIADLKKAKTNKNLFRGMTVTKYTAAIALPVLLMGFVLPKSNFALTNYLLKKDAEKGLIPERYLKDKNFNIPKKTGNRLDIYDTNKSNISLNSSNDDRFTTLNSMRELSFNKKKCNNPTFTGFASFMTGLTQQQKMAMTDGGLGLGRVGTSRRKNEAIENGVRVAGMMYLNFVAPKQIDKGLDKLITKTFGINPSLDPKIMANKRFLALVRSDKLELPNSQEEVIDFIDNNPKSLFSKIAAQKGEVKFLKSGVRDPRCYVNTEKVFKLSEQMRDFAKNARGGDTNASKNTITKNVVKYTRKALFAKSSSILTNIAISSSLLAVALPQTQFLLRKLLFKSDVDPGLV